MKKSTCLKSLTTCSFKGSCSRCEEVTDGGLHGLSGKYAMTPRRSATQIPAAERNPNKSLSLLKVQKQICSNTLKISSLKYFEKRAMSLRITVERIVNSLNYF